MDIDKTAIFLKYLTSNLGLNELTSFQLVKLVYLFQEMGLFLGYRFGWFIYDPANFTGPFSIGPSSSQLLYYEDEIREKMGTLTEDISLSSKEREILDKVIGIIKTTEEKLNLNEAYIDYILELITSLHFAFRYVDMPGSEEDRINRLNEVKPELKKEHLALVLGILKKFSLI